VTTSRGQVAGATQQAAGQTATTAKDEATQVGQVAASAASDVAGTAKQQAGHVAGEAVNQLKSLTDDAKSQASQQVSQATDKLSSTVRSLAGEMRDMGQGKGDANGTLAGLVQQLADKGEQLADQISQRGPDGLVQDLRRFAARKPGTFLLGALAAGVVTGRLVKGATAESGSSAGTTGTGYGTTGTGYGTTSYAAQSDLSLSAAPPVAPVTVTTQETTYLGDVPVTHSDDSGILDDATTSVGPVSGDDRLRAEGGLDEPYDRGTGLR
jgi:uncharacterized protein YjbJ (UPF0337 family)